MGPKAEGIMASKIVYDNRKELHDELIALAQKYGAIPKGAEVRSIEIKASVDSYTVFKCETISVYGAKVDD